MSEEKIVAMYLRKSRSDLEAEARGETDTLYRHRQALLALAQHYGYTVTQIYEEVRSGEMIADRPQVQNLLKDVASNQYGAVLVMDLDRLGRGNMIDQGLIQQTFRMSKTLIITPRKTYDLENELDEEWSEFESFLARRELKLITRRMHRGRRQSAMQGKFVGKQPPFGFCKGDDLKLYPDPEQAPVVRMIFEWRAKGMGRIKIAQKLDDMCFPSASGGKWESVTVRDMLRNEAYIGTIVFGQTKYHKDANGQRHVTRLPRDQWIIAKDAHEPIIDMQLWNQVQEVNRSHNPHTKIDYELKNPLAGVVRCGLCGKAMVRRNHSGRNRPMYLCTTYRCNTRISRFDDVEERLIQQLRKIVTQLPSEDINIGKRQDKSELDFLKIKLVKSQEDLKLLTTQKDKLHDLLEQGVYDVETFLSRSRKISETEEKLNRSIADIQAHIKDIEGTVHQMSTVLPAMNRFLEQYNNTLDVTKKNKLLKAIVKEVRYFRGKDWPADKPFELEVYLRV